MRLATITLLVLASCGQVPSVGIKSEASFEVYSEPYLILTLAPLDGQAYCFPTYQFNDFYGSLALFDQAGKRLPPKLVANRESQFVGGVDMVDGVFVVKSKPKKFMLALTKFEANLSIVSKADFELEYFACSEINNSKIPMQKLHIITVNR